MNVNLESGLEILFRTLMNKKWAFPRKAFSLLHCSVSKLTIVKSVCPGVDCFLYVDDFCICFRSKHMHTIERQLQQVLNNLRKWSSENGFKFSKTKTKCMHFCQSRKLHLDPELTLDDAQIKVVPHFKFLGLLFDLNCRSFRTSIT